MAWWSSAARSRSDILRPVAILLAAGGSRRFGRPNKLLARFGRESVVTGALEALLAAPAARRLAILGCDAPRLERYLHRRAPDLHTVRNRGWAGGLTTSLALAAHQLRPHERWVLLFIADTPLIRTDEGHRLVRAVRPGVLAARTVWNGVPGHPVLLHRLLLGGLGVGDHGLGKEIATLPPHAVRTLPGSRRGTADVDTPAALRRARRLR